MNIRKGLSPNLMGKRDAALALALPLMLNFLLLTLQLGEEPCFAALINCQKEKKKGAILKRVIH